MQRVQSWVVIVAVAAVALSAGCGSRVDVVVVRPGEPVIVEGPPVVVTDDAATIAEIDAIRRLTFNTDQTRGLKRVATRPHLGHAAQIHLIEAALELAFNASQKEVLLALVGNPGFCPSARVHLLGQLQRLAFESAKRDLLAAMDRAQALAPCHICVEAAAGHATAVE